MGVLITEQHKPYNTALGQYSCENCADALDLLFESLAQDIQKYALAFFDTTHCDLGKPSPLYTINTYLRAKLAVLTQDTISELKSYLIQTNQAYQSYRKNNKLHAIEYFSLVTPPPCLTHWVHELSHLLTSFNTVPSFSDSELIKYTTILFRDIYDFYNLQ